MRLLNTLLSPASLRSWSIRERRAVVMGRSFPKGVVESLCERS
jgi:hypothetical protein